MGKLEWFEFIFFGRRKDFEIFGASGFIISADKRLVWVERFPIGVIHLFSVWAVDVEIEALKFAICLDLALEIGASDTMPGRATGVLEERGDEVSAFNTVVEMRA